MIDWKKERQEFPVCDENSYFLSAATGPIPKKVFAAYQAGLELLHQQGSIEEEKFFAAQEEARLAAAACLQVPPESVAFLANTSLGMAFLASMLLSRAQQRKIPKPEIIFSTDEFPSSVLPWTYQGLTPIAVSSVKGVTSISDILGKVGPNTVAVVHSAVQYLSGFKQDIKLLASELKKKNVPLIVNATQAIGAIPFHPQSLGVAAMTASLHKWACAGFGLSLLYMDEEFKKDLRAPMIGWASVKDTWRLSTELTELHPLPRTLETGISPILNFMAVKVAFAQIQRLRLEGIQERNWQLAKKLALGLKEKGVNLYSAQDWEKDHKNSSSSSLVSFILPKAEEMQNKFKRESVYLSLRKGVFRAAVHYFNDEFDIEQLLSLI